MIIRTKAEFYRLSDSGQLGNTIPSWPTVAAARSSGYHGPVMIRDMTPSSSYMRPDVPMSQVESTIAHLATIGANPATLYLTQMTPCCNRIINAELIDLPSGLSLHYSTAQTHLRAALESFGRHATGSAALAILRHACDGESLDDLYSILDRYPGHAIELTAYESPIGRLAHMGRRVVIWETRLF